MTRPQLADRAAMLVDALNCEVAAAWARRPSCPWPRKTSPLDGWAEWAQAAANQEVMP